MKKVFHHSSAVNLRMCFCDTFPLVRSRLDIEVKLFFVSENFSLHTSVPTAGGFKWLTWNCLWIIKFAALHFVCVLLCGGKTQSFESRCQFHSLIFCNSCFSEKKFQVSSKLVVSDIKSEIAEKNVCLCLYLSKWNFLQYSESPEGWGATFEPI